MHSHGFVQHTVEPRVRAAGSRGCLLRRALAWNCFQHRASSRTTSFTSAVGRAAEGRAAGWDTVGPQSSCWLRGVGEEEPGPASSSAKVFSSAKPCCSFISHFCTVGSYSSPARVEYRGSVYGENCTQRRTDESQGLHPSSWRRRVGR